MKYSLTDEAKETARLLVEGWVAGRIEQYLRATIRHGDGMVVPNSVVNAPPDFEPPPFAIWRELAEADLVKVDAHHDYWEIWLLQPLRDAVTNDFQMPDSVRRGDTMNITVHGDIHGALIAALNIGEVNLSTNQQIADHLTHSLGQEFVQAQDSIRNAIEELRESIEEERPSKVGKFISELGRCLEHGSNAATVIEAIVRASPILLKLLGG